MDHIIHPMGERFDVIVVGAGPAGLALSQALLTHGLDVMCVDERAGTPWRATWGMWTDEAVALDLADLLAATAAVPRVRFAPEDEVVLSRSYSIVDAGRLQARLAQGVPLLRRAAAIVDADAIVLEHGEVLRARFVVDARGRSASQAAQTAWGAVLETSSIAHTWMDFSIDHRDGDARPTFGYVVPLTESTTLVEETALAASPAMERSVLAARLSTRLDALGVGGGRVHVGAHEWVSIALDGKVPAPTAPYPFGVRAGAAHPATGYALARTLADAPLAADAIARGVRSAEDAPRIARRMHRAIWSTPRRITRWLHNLGRDAILAFDIHDARTFFRAFFALEGAHQAAVLSTLSSPVAVARAMGSMWLRLPRAQRSKLLPKWDSLGALSSTMSTRHEASSRN